VSLSFAKITDDGRIDRPAPVIAALLMKDLREAFIVGILNLAALNSGNQTRYATGFIFK
jgi:hypothetical protein